MKTRILMALLGALAILSAALALACPASAQFATQRQIVTSAAGSANAQTGTVQNATSYNDVLNVWLTYVPAATNSGDATFTMNGLGTSPHFAKLTTGGLTTLTGQELVNGVPAIVMYDGTYFVILSANTAPAPVAPPQGRLTLVTGVPVMTGDVAAATAIYYTPYVGTQIPIWTGSTFQQNTFPQLTITIPSSRLANTIYDVYVFLNSGTVTGAIGPAWTTSTAGSGSRGTGAGTAELARIGGLLVNAVSISAVNGASTYTIAANLGTYVGTLFMDGTNGQVSFLATYGQSRKNGFWNYYNRVPLTLRAGDPTAGPWFYTGGIRPQNNSALNSISIGQGAGEEIVTIQNLSLMERFTGSAPQIGVGWNSTSAFCGMVAGGNPADSTTLTYQSSCVQLPFIGLGVATALEAAVGGSGGGFYGTQANMQLSASWRY